MASNNKSTQILSEKEESQMDLVSNTIIDIILDSGNYFQDVKQSSDAFAKQNRNEK